MQAGRKGVLILSVLVAVAATAVESLAQQRLTENVVSDPSAARFVYKDVENFVRAMEKVASGTDTAAVLRAEYFDQATPGLQMFTQKYDLTLERLLEAIRRHPQKYSSLHESLAALRSQESNYRKIYADLQGEIQNAVFPPTYFLVGAHRGIGSGSVEGPLITIEKKTIESISADLPATLVHEMVQMQQLAALGEAYFAIFNGEQKTLLALSVREGVATYFAERVAGGSVHKNLARKFLLEHEENFWRRFRPEMLGHETGEWLWSSPGDPQQPRDLGYAIGARIVETFYERAEDKDEAVRAILAITDYEKFLARSGYGEGGDVQPEK